MYLLIIINSEDNFLKLNLQKMNRFLGLLLCFAIVQIAVAAPSDEVLEEVEAKREIEGEGTPIASASAAGQCDEIIDMCTTDDDCPADTKCHKFKCGYGCVIFKKWAEYLNSNLNFFQNYLSELNKIRSF